MLHTFIHINTYSVSLCRKLLRGEAVEYHERGRHSQIRFLDREHGYINVHDPVPIYLAASYPKALALAGELGDGLITVSTLSPDALTATLAKAAKGRQHRRSQKAGAGYACQDQGEDRKPPPTPSP